MTLKIGALLTHPVQYYSPWLAELAGSCNLTVYYAHQQTAEGQGKAGFGAGFEWDVPLLEGYDWRWLKNVARSPGLTRFGGCDTPEIGDIIRCEKFDAFLIFGWNRKCFIQAAWAALRSRTPLLIRLDSELNTPRSKLALLLKKLAYSVVLPKLGDYLSPGVRTDAYLRHYGVQPDRIHRLPHMIDTVRFATGAQAARQDGSAAALRARHGAAENDFALLFAGKLIPLKRVDLVLEALAVLKRQRPELAARTRLWIAGDGPLRAELEARAAAEGLNVSFLGFVNQSALPAVYAAADCLVLPSQWETWGLVVNEAFACGLPASVSERAGCAPELIEEGVTGWTMRSFEPGHLADLIATAATAVPTLATARIGMLSDDASFAPGVRRVLNVVQSIRQRAASGRAASKEEV